LLAGGKEFKMRIVINIPNPYIVVTVVRAVTGYVKVMVFGPEGEHVTDMVVPPLPTEDEDDYDYDCD
jgi:hypothetical protein